MSLFGSYSKIGQFIANSSVWVFLERKGEQFNKSMWVYNNENKSRGRAMILIIENEIGMRQALVTIVEFDFVNGI